MKSIRLSLVVYFLLLLAGALGAICVLAYRTAERNLETTRAKLQKLFRDQYQAKLDDLLLAEARTLANVVKVQAENRNWRHMGLQARLGLLGAVLAPDAPFATPVWALQLARGPVQGHIWAMGFQLKIKDMRLPPEQEGQLTQFVQINSITKNEWHSPSLGDHSLPLNAAAFSGKQLVDWKFSDVTLDGKPLRRVTFKLSRFQIDFGPPMWGGFKGGPGRRPDKGPARPDKGPARRPEGPRSAFPPPPVPAIYIQSAYDTARTDGVIGQMRDELAKNLEQVDRSAEENLHGLRRTLLAISMITFAATLLGVFSLVRLGLLPLRRVSEAVSQVSEKDFHLPLSSGRMPTELQPIVDRLQQTFDLLKRAFAREKQAAADISHELRTPLAALLTTLDVALRKPRKVEEYREVLEECRSSGQHMHGLVERLLALARLDAGVDHLRPREVDVVELAEQCASMVRPLAEARGLSLRFHKNGPASLTADPDKLREVVTNLLHNAIQYNRPDGAIDLAVERQNGNVRVEVRDTGIGIAPEARQHIFERFYRADPSRAAEGLHAGLGLAIVKGYIDLMGGSIDVESTEGEGSTFRVRLPVRAAAAHG